jgi:hypothetical protein
MSWGRGFFRAWVVVSAVWIGFAVLIAGPKTYLWLWKAPIYEIELKSGQRMMLDTSLSHSDLLATLAAELKQEGLGPGQSLDPTTRDEILTSIDSRYETAGDQARRAWLVTALPPLGLLAFGLCIGWVFRGFKRR